MTTKTSLPRTLVGVTAATVGCWWTWIVLLKSLLGMLEGAQKGTDGIFLFVIGPAMAIPGVLAAFFGYRLLRNKDVKYYRGAVGFLAFFGAVCVVSLLKSTFGFALNERVRLELFWLLATLTVMPFYLLLVSFLMRKEGIETRDFKRLGGRGIILIVSWEIWSLATAICETHFQTGQYGAHFEERVLITGAVPIALAWMFYKCATNWSLPSVRKL